MKTHTMIPSEMVPVVASRFRALADPARLQLLSALHDGERSVGELVAALGRSQPNVSQHLANLSRAGLVAARRDGQRVLYRLADPYLERICDAVCASLSDQATRDVAAARALKRRVR